MRNIDIGVFAHNEETKIGELIKDLSKQTLINHPNNAALRIRILCNGCTDNTVRVTRDALASSGQLSKVTFVDNFAESGKSRTWNRFVSEIGDESQYTIFMDSDIRIPDADALLNLIDDLEQSDAVAITSRPKKYLRKLRRKPLLYLAASTINREHRDGPIAGSLYAVRTEEIRHIRLPVPCLVEDGFLSACLITGIFSHQRRPERVKASDRVSHFFEPPGSISSFFRHDVRLALGCELNAALYSALWYSKTVSERTVLMAKFSETRGIDQCIVEHQKYPERSALPEIRLLNEKRSNKAQGRLRRLVHFPVTLAHKFYMSKVRERARKLFGRSQFTW